ncbi:MAG: glycosyltransferase family 4 protein [Patescibacteria group bacterium]
MLRALFSKPYSRLFIVGDNANWSVDDDARDLKEFARKLGIKARIVRRTPWNIPQAVHYTSQFSLIDESVYKFRHRISVDYYHGKPEQQESFRKCFETLQKNHEKLSRVRVSNKEMEGLIKSTGINPDKVMRIPIPVDTNVFTPATRESRRNMRVKLGIPDDAVVIGSFQKDGVGWGEGMEPKLIKGPDTFLKVIEKLKSQVPNLWVLLSGPARGFVKNGLEKIGVPYAHRYANNSNKIAEFFDAIDLYIITSREEGGPKACLQSMAKGVPLVTTEVGQCKDLVKSGENAMMVPVDDIKGLYEASLELLNNSGLSEKLVKEGKKTAEENNFESQLPLWKAFFKNLVTS